MRKNNILLTSLLLCCLSVVGFIDAAAQPVESFRASTNITPQVESFQIAQSGDLTPSLYTGAMTYSLLLYTYSDPDFNIPISLDYNYDGYKVARSSGTVGLGWALNCGGVITREIRGLKDEYVKEHYNGDAYTQYGYYWVFKNHVGIDYNFSINRPRTPNLETILSPADLVRHLNDDLYEDIPVSTYGDSYDISPDLFHFCFGSYSGDFKMNHDGTLTLTSPTHPQGEFEVTVETTPGLGGTSLKFTIKTGDGYEYVFGDSIDAREYNTSTVIKDECPDETSTAGSISGWTDTAWKLTKIKAPNGRTVVFSYKDKPVLSEYRFFNMMTGWMSFFQNRFYPKLSDINETRFEAASGADSGMSFRTHYAYDRQTGQILGESRGTPDKSNSIEYVYCSSNPTAKDACHLRAAVSDVIASVWQNDSTLYTGRFHFGYQPNMKGIHPVSLTEYVLDIPSPLSPSETNSRTETTNVTYNKLLRPTNVNMEGDAYIKYDWDSFGRHIISKTVNGDEGKTEYEWKDLVGLTSVKDPTGRVTRYEYNDKGRLSGVRDSDSSLVASYVTYLKSDEGSAQNRTTAYRHLSEDGSVKVGDSKFYNGLGYLYQTISECASGDGANLILPVEYDSMLRPDLKSYLPYPGKSGIWYADNNASTNQSQWYFNNYSTRRAFVERTFETGVSGRPLTEQKPGGVYQTAGKRVRFSYSLNEPGDSVFTFIYNYPSATSTHPSITCSGRSEVRTLARVTAVNEDNDTTQTFTDAAGRLILKRQLNDGKRHDTYHIYDLKDSLVCVIQPTGSDGLSVGKVMPYNGTFIQDSCFTWQYDGKGQLTASHVSGAGTKSYLYDPRGRVVYKDDGNIARAGGSGWYFVYDDLDRLTESGIGVKAYNNSDILDGLAEGFDIKTFLYQTRVLKEYDYYSKRTTSNSGIATFEPVDGVVSADDVSGSRCATMLSSEKVFDAPYYYAANIYPGGTTIFRLGNTDGYIRRTYWYDKKGRIIQKLETTGDGWTSRYSIKYDFSGNAVATMEKHASPSGQADSILTVNNYDRRGRLTSYARTLNGNQLDSVFYSYDFAGRILCKRTGFASSTSPSGLTEAYSRDLRGWMTGITVNDLKLGQVFTESLEYMSPTLTATPLFSGNISEVNMSGYGQSSVQNTYRYDHLGRLLGNDRFVDGESTSAGTETGLRYDLNGNIMALTRNDGASRYTMRMSHTGNRIKECAIEPDDQSGVSQTYSCSYDFNGNMTNICRSNDIWYNILDLPHHSAGNTYNYYSDGTKAEVRDSSDMRWIYKGNFTYRKIHNQGGGDVLWLDSVRYPDGQIFCGPQVPTNSDADCWHIKDHLGNIRAVYCLNSEGTMPVFEVNDYLPFGGRIRNNADPQFSANRFRYAGKEEYDNFAVTESRNDASIAVNDFGARYLISFLGSWTSPDPLAYKSPDKTSYGYCSSNPINKIDKTGEWDVTVHLYKDRKEYGYGIAIVTAKSGKEIYRFNVRAEGVKGHNRFITGADTPLGVYDIPDSNPWISGRNRASYGPNARLSMIGIDGEIVESGRNSIRIHGGRQEIYNKDSNTWSTIPSPKLKKTYGCLRAYDKDMKEFKDITDNLMNYDSDEYPGLVFILDDLEKVTIISPKNYVEVITDYQAPSHNDYDNTWERFWLNLLNILK